MTRYVPSAEEQAAIDLLRLAGFAVVRQRTYDNLRAEVALTEHLRTATERDRDHTRSWALDAFAEQRRLADRLTRVVAAAASLGVSIQDINTALDGADA